MTHKSKPDTIARLYGLAEFYYLETYWKDGGSRRPTNAETVTINGEDLGSDWSCDEWTMYKTDYDVISYIKTTL